MRELMIGEALVGDGNEVAHIELLIGPKNGAVGAAFAHCLADQTVGHNALLAVLAPNVPAKPSTVMFNKVTIKGSTQAVQIFGSAQAAVAMAVVDSVAEGVIPERYVEDLVVIVGVFVHWEATDNQKIYDLNYRATKAAIKRAMAGQPSMDEILAQKDKAWHPFFPGPGGKEPEKGEQGPTPRAESPPARS
jgi:5,6,7,8-tetrahydromethanopterin hydro-lyase